MATRVAHRKPVVILVVLLPGDRAVGKKAELLVPSRVRRVHPWQVWGSGMGLELSFRAKMDGTHSVLLRYVLDIFILTADLCHTASCGNFLSFLEGAS